jgi:hypothetical protein
VEAFKGQEASVVPSRTSYYCFQVLNSDIISNNVYKIKATITFLHEERCEKPSNSIQTIHFTSHLSPMQYLRIKDMQRWIHRDVGLLS